MPPIFFDTETVGYYGVIVTIQYAEGDGEIVIHNVWTSPVSETIILLEKIINNKDGIVGFNLAFDVFHLYKLYTILIQFHDPDAYPIDHIDEMAAYEFTGRDCKLVLKPFKCCDLMLHARKTEYQSLMDRDDIRVKKVPTVLVEPLIIELEKRIKLKEIYFEKRKGKRWQIEDVKDELGFIRPDVKNLVLKFAPSTALKALAHDCLDIDKGSIIRHFEIPVKAKPKEIGYAPFAYAVGTPDDWKGAWPEKVQTWITFFGYNELNRQYASDDVKYTRLLYKYFGEPEMNDVDSVLACMVAVNRWRGFAVDIEKLQALKSAKLKEIENAPIQANSPKKVLEWLCEVMDDQEQLALVKDEKLTTDGKLLEPISNWRLTEICHVCGGVGCEKCSEIGFIETDEFHPAAKRAKIVLDIRHAGKDINLFNKLLSAGRFHASFKIIGAKSTRMSGDDDLNPQGIQRAKEIRSCFTLALEDMVLNGGDFDAFEVGLADAVYGDPKLREILTSKRICHVCGALDLNCEKCKGRGWVKTSIHALFGTYLFPGHTYEQILATKKLPGEQDLYSRAKQGVFALLYGGDANTLVVRVAISKTAAENALKIWNRDFIVWGQERKKIFDKFCSMRQDGGLGTIVTWADPCEYAESKLGFKRYFTLENKICKALFDIAEDPPEEWMGIEIKIKRRDREQFVGGALRSAVFAAAFAIQAAAMRAAANHEIQSFGAQILKALQVEIWNIQPSGIHDWLVQLLNIHDELETPCKKEVVKQIVEIVKNFVEKMRALVPLISIDWHENMESWSEK